MARTMEEIEDLAERVHRKPSKYPAAVVMAAQRVNLARQELDNALLDFETAHDGKPGKADA
jgi:hypothetical protein